MSEVCSRLGAPNRKEHPVPANNYATVRLVCRHRTEYPLFCVRSEHTVPEPLSCVPSAGGAGGAWPCNCYPSLPPKELERRLNVMTPPWGEWIKQGAVVTEI